MNRVIHFDIAAKNPEKAADFYKKTFGWKFEKWEGPMDYWMITTGSNSNPGINGGMSLKKDSGGMSSQTIEVKDIDKKMDEIRSHGGKISTKKMAIPGVGWYAEFRDPEGNHFGLMQDDKHAM